MKHCCDRMREEVARACVDGSDRSRCADAIVEYVPKYDEYGVVVHDGGSSMIRIHFCPWCGVGLPESKRDLWFDELEKRGVDPRIGPLPPEFETDAWYWKIN